MNSISFPPVLGFQWFVFQVSTSFLDEENSAKKVLKIEFGFYQLEKKENPPPTSVLWELYNNEEPRRTFMEIGNPKKILNVITSKEDLSFHPVQVPRPVFAIQSGAKETAKKDPQPEFDLRETVDIIRQSFRKTQQLALLKSNDLLIFSEEHQHQFMEAKTAGDLDEWIVYILKNRWSATELHEKVKESGKTLEMPSLSKYLSLEPLPHVRTTLLELLKNEDSGGCEDLKKRGRCRDLYLVRVPQEPSLTDPNTVELFVSGENVERWNFPEWTAESVSVAAAPHAITMLFAEQLLRVLNSPQKTIYTNGVFSDPKWKLEKKDKLTSQYEVEWDNVESNGSTTLEQFKNQLMRYIQKCPQRSAVFLSPCMFDIAYRCLLNKSFHDPNRERAAYIERLRREDDGWRKLSAKASRRFFN